jgi:hypothetical protein
MTDIDRDFKVRVGEHASEAPPQGYHFHKKVSVKQDE